MWRLRRFRIIRSLRHLNPLPCRHSHRPPHSIRLWLVVLLCPRRSSSFMNFYTYEDLAELEQWTVDARAARRDPAARIEEPEVSYNLKIFLIYVYGRQWEIKLLRESGEVLIEQMKAYLAGYNQLTGFNRRQWLRLFLAWTAQERRDQLETLADAGGFLVI